MTDAERNLRVIISKHFDTGKVRLLDCSLLINNQSIPVSRCSLVIGDSNKISSFKLKINNVVINLSNIRRNNLLVGKDVSKFYRLVFKSYFIFSELLTKLSVGDKFPRDLLSYPYLKRLDKDTLEDVYLFLSLGVPLPHYLELAIVKGFFFDYVKNNHKLSVRDFKIAVNCYAYHQDYIISYLFPDVCRGFKSILNSIQNNGKCSLGEVSYAEKLFKMVSPSRVETAMHLDIFSKITGLPRAVSDIVGELKFSQSRYGLTEKQYNYLYLDREQPIKRICLFTFYKEQMYDYIDSNGISFPIFYPSADSRVFKAENKNSISQFTGVILPDEILNDIDEELTVLKKNKKEIEESISQDNHTSKEYNRLRQEQVYAQAKIDRLNELLRQGRHSRRKSRLAIVGSEVTVMILDGSFNTYTFTLVEHSGGENKVSQDTPFFKSIRGKRVNQIFKVVGPMNDVFYYKLLSIR